MADSWDADLTDGQHQDDLIDKLPWHLKNKVLEYDEDAEPAKTKKAAWRSIPRSLRWLWYSAFALSMVWAALVGLIGILCMIIPVVGIPVLTFAGYPGAALITWRAKAIEQRRVAQGETTD